MNEIKVAVEQNLGTIVISNFEEIKENVNASMEVYKGLEVTADNLAERKKDVAVLRKINTALDTKRKEVKAACMKPYDSVLPQFDELKELINEPVDLINKQMVVYEQKRLAEKKQLINDIYLENIADMKEYLPLEKIYDKKWENVATSKKRITESIQEVVKSTQIAVSAILSMTSDSVSDALALYKKNLDLAGAIAFVNKYEANRAEIIKREQERKEAEKKRKKEAEERRIKAEQERQDREAREKATAEQRRIEREKKEKEGAKAMAKVEINPSEAMPFSADSHKAFYTSGPEPFVNTPAPFTVPTNPTVTRSYILTGKGSDIGKVLEYADKLGIDVKETK